jgi:hypothetical protein
VSKPTDTSKISNPNSPTRYYRAAEERAKKLKPINHELTHREVAEREAQRQQMFQRDLIDRSRAALDEDSQLCQQFYVTMGSGRGLSFDVDALVDLL